MIEDLDGKVVLITGASTGIGAAAARAFGANGARVAVHYNSSEPAARAVAADVRKAGGDSLLVAGDVTKPGAAKAIVDKVVAAGAHRRTRQQRRRPGQADLDR